MTSVGIFAGRGDVIVAMALALAIGIWVGWRTKGLFIWAKSKFKK